MKRLMRRFRKQFRYGEKGFTLVELLVVVAILGIIAAVIAGLADFCEYEKPDHLVLMLAGAPFVPFLALFLLWRSFGRGIALGALSLPFLTASIVAALALFDARTHSEREVFWKFLGISLFSGLPMAVLFHAYMRAQGIFASLRVPVVFSLASLPLFLGAGVVGLCLLDQNVQRGRQVTGLVGVGPDGLQGDVFKTDVIHSFVS